MSLSRREKRENPDIKAPDGFLLGGLRLVRRGGIVKMNGWWHHPDLVEHVGQRVWVHVMDGWATEAEFAPPGLHIYEARNLKWTKALADGRPATVSGEGE